MKSLVVFVLVLFISIPICSAVEIQELFTISGSEEVEEVNSDNVGVVTYFYSGNKLIASKEMNGNLEYEYQDRLGSDINTKTLPFGQEISSDFIFSFTGKELDSSNLYYFGARYYDPNLGRFTSIDPVKGNNIYAYVENNPMNYVDPSGNEIEDSKSVTLALLLSPQSNRGYFSSWGINGLHVNFPSPSFDTTINLNFLTSGTGIGQVIHPIYGSFNLQTSYEFDDEYSMQLSHTSAHTLSTGMSTHTYQQLKEYPSYVNELKGFQYYFSDEGEFIEKVPEYEWTSYSYFDSANSILFRKEEANFLFGLGYAYLRGGYVDSNHFLDLSGSPVLLGGVKSFDRPKEGLFSRVMYDSSPFTFSSFYLGGAGDDIFGLGFKTNPFTLFGDIKTTSTGQWTNKENWGISLNLLFPF